MNRFTSLFRRPRGSGAGRTREATEEDTLG